MRKDGRERGSLNRRELMRHACDANERGTFLK